MFKAIFYKDKDGKSEVSDFLEKLSNKAKTSKNARINKEKILAYIKALEEHGTRIGEPIVKHIDGDLWELRPLSNRIFFFYWKDNKFVLLHYFTKKTQKTPKKEIERAINYMSDWIERNE